MLKLMCLHLLVLFRLITVQDNTMLKHRRQTETCRKSLITVQDNTMLKLASPLFNIVSGLITVQDNTMLKLV